MGYRQSGINNKNKFDSLFTTRRPLVTSFKLFRFFSTKLIQSEFNWKLSSASDRTYFWALRVKSETH